MADLMAMAKAAYRVGINDADLVATWRAERAALVSSMLTDPGFGSSITSATVNGQSFSGSEVMTNDARLGLLDRVIEHIDAGVPPSSRTYARF